jgi:hypothetical protein
MQYKTKNNKKIPEQIGASVAIPRTGTLAYGI